jgi:hypothetical protein
MQFFEGGHFGGIIVGSSIISTFCVRNHRCIVGENKESKRILWYLETLLLLRFGYLGKWPPCVCELLNTCGKYFVPCTMYLMSNFTFT